MLSQVDPEGKNRIEGREAVEFLSRSGLDHSILKEIWNISAQTSKSFLDRDEFYIALRLIAYAQNGMAVNEQSIMNNVEVSLPKMGGTGMPTP